MSCDVAALPFQAHDNYGTLSIDFDFQHHNLIIPILYSNISVALKIRNNYGAIQLLFFLILR